MLNTDAEGRLILGDALALASEAEPDAIVDLATLTGAVEIALGSRVAGLLGNDDGWRDQVAGRRRPRRGSACGRCRCPPTTGRSSTPTSPTCATSPSPAAAAPSPPALFLQEFVGEGIPWAHLDIAGTAWWAEGDQAEFANGGTGYGVRAAARAGPHLHQAQARHRPLTPPVSGR